MVEKTDIDSVTGCPVRPCSNDHNLLLHRVNGLEEYLTRLFRNVPEYMQQFHSKYHCCNKPISPAEWPLLAQTTDYVPPPLPTPAHLETQRSSPSISTASTSTNSNHNEDAMVQEDDNKVDPEKEEQKQEELTPAPPPPPVVELVVETAPEVVPRPCSVIRHVSSDSLASLVAPPEPSPVISPCSSVSPSPVPAPTSAANENSIDGDQLPPSAQPSSNVDSSTLNQDQSNQPKLPEDDNQSMTSTDTELAPENTAAINDTCEDEDTSTIPESNGADHFTGNEPGATAEVPERNMGIEDIKAEVDSCEMPNTATAANTFTSTATNQSFHQNGQNSKNQTEQDDVEEIDLTIDEETTPPASHTNDGEAEVAQLEALANDDEVEVTQLELLANDDEVEVTELESLTNDEDVTPPESHTKESRKRKLPGCTGAIRMMSIKPNEPNKHWKKNIATPFIKGNSTIVSNLPKTNSSTGDMNGNAASSGSKMGGLLLILDPQTNKRVRVTYPLANVSHKGAPPPKKRLHNVSDSPPSPPPSRRARPKLLPPRHKRDDSSYTSSEETLEDIDQDDDEDMENNIIPALYPDVELKENQSQDNQPPAVSDTDDCVVLDDDSQQPDEIQLLPTPESIVNAQSLPPPVQSSSSVGLSISSREVPSGPPSNVSSAETIVSREDYFSPGEVQEGEEDSDDSIEILDDEDNVPSASTAAIPLPNDNSVQIVRNTAGHNQRNTVSTEKENQNGSLPPSSSLQQQVSKDHSKFTEYRRHSAMGSSGKKAEDNILQQTRNESSMSCNDDDTDNGSQKDQDPQMPVLRLPIPVSPSNENGNANIEAPALILHPGGRVSPAPMNENGRANIDARERILDIEEDRDMGGVGGDEKSEDEAERSYVVQRRSRRKRVKSSKLNGFADEYEEFQSMNEYGETDDEGFRNAADETFEVDVVSNTQEENDDQVMRSDRKKRVSSDQRWFQSEHKNYAKITIRSGKMQGNVDWRPANKADYPSTQRGKKRGRVGRPKKLRRSDTDTEGGWRGPKLHKSSSRPSATTDCGGSSNDDEPLINKKVRTQSLGAMGPRRSGDNDDDADDQMLRFEENDDYDSLRDSEPIAGSSKVLYPTVPQPSTSNDTSRLDVPVISLSGDDMDDDGYIEDSWPVSGNHDLDTNPADTSVYTERLSGVEDPDATTVVDFLSEHGSQASTTTTAASLSSTPGSLNRNSTRTLKRGIPVECPKCHRLVSNHFMNRHLRSKNCDRKRPPRPIGGAMTDYDSQTEAEPDDDMVNGELQQQKKKRPRGRPRGSKMGKCPYCRKTMLQSSVRSHFENKMCLESRIAFESSEQVAYNSQEDSQTEDEGWDHNDNEYGGNGDGGSVVSATTNSSPVVKIKCPDCGLKMLKTSLRNHVNQNRCKRRSASSSAAAAAATISTTSTNINHIHNSTNQNDDMGDGSGTGDGEQSQGYLTNKKRDRSCRRVAKYNCDDEDDESFFENETSGYDRVVSSPLPPDQQNSFDDCPYADCNYEPEKEEDYRLHATKEHPPGQGFSCDSCKRIYVCRLNLETHQKTHVPRFPFDATMVSYIKNPALQPRVVISNDDAMAARQYLQL